MSYGTSQNTPPPARKRTAKQLPKTAVSQFSSSNEDVNELLIFTNGKGEPKCIDVNRCLNDLGVNGDLSQVITDSQDRADFVEACPRVELTPITFNFVNEGPQRSRFINSKGIQFSYQAIYKKGFFSSLAPYSELAVPPKFFATGTDSMSTIEKDVENVCVLNIPTQGSEVVGVRLIFREGNDGIARIFDDIYFEAENANGGGSADFDFDNANDGVVGTYAFRNDKTGFLMSETDRLKTFDNVPREAFAQEVTEDRVVYGNYKEGYDNITVDVETDVQYNEAPPPGYDFDLKAISTVFKRRVFRYTDKSLTDVDGNTYEDATDASGTTKNNRISEQMGFLLDDRSLPDQIVGGDYNISISVSPKKNFHFFSGRNSAPSSLFNVNLTNVDGVQNASIQNVIQFINEEGSYDSMTMSSGMSDQTQDVGSVHQAPGSISRDPGLTWQSSIGTITASSLVVGGCAQAPIIIHGKPLSFRARIVVPAAGVSKTTFMNSLTWALWGGGPSENPILAQGGQQTFPNDYETWTSSYSFDLGLEDGQSFDHETSDLANKISTVGRTFNPAPKGFFVVNKATPTFCLEPAMSDGDQNSFEFGRYYGETGERGKYQVDNLEGSGVTSIWGMKVTLANLTGVETKTCFPFPKQGFGSLVATNVYTSTENIGNSVTDLDQRIRAKRFGKIGTSLWDYTGRNLPQGDQTLVWPSTQRNLHLPSAGPQGPACQAFDGDVSTPNHAHLQGVQVEFTSDGGNLPMSLGANVTLGAGVEGNFDNSFIETTNNLIDTNQREKWMPAPIGKWVIVDDAANKGASFWSNSLGMNAYLDVDGSTEFTELFKEGRPSTMLPGISGHYEGGFVGITNTNGFSRLLYSFSTWPGSNNATTLTDLKSRAVYSCIDGDAGPGGASSFATRTYGERGGGASDAWGSAFGRGTHNLDDSSQNIVGSHANVNGSVTAFSLIGICDTLPGLGTPEVMRRGVNDFSPAAFITSRLMTSFNELAYPFVLTSPRYHNTVDLATNGIEVIKEAHEMLGMDAGQGDTKTVNVLQSYSNDEFFTPAGDQFFNTYTTTGFIESLAYNTLTVVGDAGFTDLKTRVVGLPENFNGGGSFVFSNVSSNSSALFTSSFKTKANHEFGIVYFDKKGRHGAVQPIESVYVRGYDERDGVNQGPATVKFKIKHAPPSWAENYRFVYAGNNSVDRFLQYTVDGAHIRDYEDNDGSNNIFLSLNTLQANDVSFQSSYSAVNQNDGSKDLYSFAEGDFLRVISYQDSSGNVIYPPESWQFQIVDKRRLSPLMENHPLAVLGADGVSTDASDLSKNGDFLVLEDNPLADGFRRASVEANSDFWSQRCIVELVRPKKELPEEATAYYEINYGGRCLDDNTNETGKKHEFQNHFIANGDIYYRSVPVNIQKYVDNAFVRVVNGTTSLDRSYSNFESIYLETEGWTDFFASKERNYGRVHFVNPKEAETTRPSSISFSEQTELGAFETRWLSFPRVGNYRDFNYVYGGIDIMDYDGVFMNTFFSDSILKVPYNRNFLMDGSEDALVASLKVFGTARDVDYDGGTNGHPESLIRIDRDYFFVSPKRREVVMLQNRTNPVVISNMNVSNYVKSEIAKSEADITKYPLGWDNVNKELIFTLYRDDVSSSYDIADDSLKSLAFDLKTKKYWKTRYSFSSPLYSIMGDNLISWHKDGSNFTHPWIHGRFAENNNFYGEQHETRFTCHVNDQINQSKKYDAVVTDSNAPWQISLSAGEPGADESLSTTIREEGQKRYYGKWYSKVPRVGAGGPAAIAPIEVPLENTSQLFHVPGFPYNAHNGQYIQPRLTYKLDENQTKIRTKLPIPIGHAFWSTAFPNGPKSKMYEKSDASGNGFDYNNSNGRLVSLTGYNNVPSISPSTNDDVSTLGGWNIVGVASNSKNFIEAEGSDEIVVDLIFEKDITNIDGQALNTLQVAYNDNADLIEDQDGYLFLDQIDWNSIYGAVYSFTAKKPVVDLLIQPTYALTFGQQGVSSAILADILIYGVGELVYNEWDFNEDGIVNISDLINFLSLWTGGAGGGYSTGDLLTLLEVYGSTASTAAVSDFNLQDADIVAFIGIVAPHCPPDFPVKKDLYSSYIGGTAGRDVRGRTLTLEFSDTTSVDKKLFGIEVDYDLDVKTPRAAVRRRPARAQGRRR